MTTKDDHDCWGCAGTVASFCARDQSAQNDPEHKNCSRWRYDTNMRGWRRETIVGVALRLEDGTMLVGSPSMRHDGLIRSICALADKPLRMIVPNTLAAQGFVTSQGRWVDRFEAWQIAKGADQIERRCLGDDLRGGQLFSENLW